MRPVGTLLELSAISTHCRSVLPMLTFPVLTTVLPSSGDVLARASHTYNGRYADMPSGITWYRRERHHPGQRHAHPLGGGRGRFSGRHPTGHDAVGGDGAVAGRVPGHGEPRAAHPADLHQRLSRHADRGGVRPGPRRDAPVLPHHRRAGRLHA